MHKAKILAELKKKFPGLSQYVLGLIADKLAKTVTEESQIEGTVSELTEIPLTPAELSEAMQKEGDRRATEAKKKFDAEKGKEKSEGEGGTEGTEGAADNPPKDANAALLAEIKAMRTELGEFRKEKNANTLKSQLVKKLVDAKKIPEKIAQKMVTNLTIEKEDQIEALTEQVNTDYLDYKQELVNSGVVSSAPANGNPGGTAAKATKEEAKSLVESLM